MTANNGIDPARFLSEHLERAEPDLLRSMLKTFLDALMGAEADAICGAPYGARTEDLVNSRNGYRAREWDTRAGTMEVAIPKLRAGFVLPGLAAGGLHPPDGEAGRDPRHHQAVEVAGLGDGQGVG